MPYFWDRTPDTLPRPELNPLTNPALERNLSRWAQVYFNNPPGQREQAISKLLQQIKNETSEILIAEQARQESSAKSTESRPADVAEIGRICCSACQQQNPPRNGFCGQCGAVLHPVRSASKRQSALGTPAPSETPSAKSDKEVQWLRDRALGSLYASEPPSRQGWKYALGGSVIALAAGLAYLQWAPGPLHRVASPPTPSAVRVTPPALPPPSENSSSAAVQPPPEATPSSAIHSVPQPSRIQTALAAPKSQDARDRRPPLAGIQPAAQKSSLLGVTLTPKAVEGGDSGLADLRLAQRYLGGGMGARDSSEGAKLLWKAVRKQNTTAAILLSGLYERGDGVPKSCDQARLLLVAAAKRGASQAAEQLRGLEAGGCR